MLIFPAMWWRRVVREPDVTTITQNTSGPVAVIADGDGYNGSLTVAIQNADGSLSQGSRHNEKAAAEQARLGETKPGKYERGHAGPVNVEEHEEPNNLPKPPEPPSEAFQLRQPPATEGSFEPMPPVDLEAVRAQNEDRLLSLPNVIGVSTGLQGIVVYTTSQDPAVIQLIPRSIDGVPITVITTEPFRTTELRPGDKFKGRSLTRRIRPVLPGYSVGHPDVTAGTIGTMVYDILPRGSINPPRNGIGIPERYYILSNNHVLANSNRARIGDPILQPGAFDGGTVANDQIGRLARFVNIDFSPDKTSQRNTVDAAIAEADFADIERFVSWIGHIETWKPKHFVHVGDGVHKTGRTTNYSVGQVVGVNATVDVNYGDGRVARMRDQIVTTNISAGGDSGSLLLDLNNTVVGLVFAGSNTLTIANQIENVRAALGVEVASKMITTEVPH